MNHPLWFQRYTFSERITNVYHRTNDSETGLQAQVESNK